jgi:uncharacterized glyoxalase superfamily protein PhnB
VTQESVPVRGKVVPYLCLEGAIEASKFYQKALAAEVAHIFPADETGRTMHVHLYINGASLMFTDPYPEHETVYTPAAGFTLMLQVGDVDASFDQAMATGCSECMAPADMFWGDRFAQVKDPYGVVWAFVGPKRPEKLSRAVGH